MYVAAQVRFVSLKLLGTNRSSWRCLSKVMDLSIGLVKLIDLVV